MKIFMKIVIICPKSPRFTCTLFVICRGLSLSLTVQGIVLNNTMNILEFSFSFFVSVSANMKCPHIGFGRCAFFAYQNSLLSYQFGSLHLSTSPADMQFIFSISKQLYYLHLWMVVSVLLFTSPSTSPKNVSCQSLSWELVKNILHFTLSEKKKVCDQRIWQPLKNMSRLSKLPNFMRIGEKLRK